MRPCQVPLVLCISFPHSLESQQLADAPINGFYDSARALSMRGTKPAKLNWCYTSMRAPRPNRIHVVIMIRKHTYPSPFATRDTLVATRIKRPGPEHIRPVNM